MSLRGWNPYAAIDYVGPYPRHQLQQSRNVLINCLRSPTSLMQQILPKCGIATRYGPAQIPPPLPSRNEPPSRKPENPAPSSLSTEMAPSVSKVQNMLDTPKSHAESNSSSQSTPRQSRTQHSDDTHEETSPAFYSNINSSGSKINSEPGMSSQGYGKATQKRKLEGNPDSSLGAKKRMNVLNEPVNVENTTQRPIETCRSFKLWKPNDEFGSNSGYVQTIFKCDTCPFASKNEKTMEEHLEALNHYSASSYKAVVKPSQILVVSVSSMLDIVNANALYKSQVIMCPNCHEVFQDIFMCALHHKKEHGSINGMYSVCSVVGETKHRPLNCSTCGKAFTGNTGKGMRKHYRENPSHDPNNRKPGKDKADLYFCNYNGCNRQFYNNRNNFNDSLLHYQAHLRKLKNNKSKEIPEFAVIERQVAISNASEELAPFNSTKKSAQWKELQVAKQLTKFYSHVHSVSKSKKSRSFQDYQELCAKLGYPEEVDGSKEQERESEEELDDSNESGEDGSTGRQEEIQEQASSSKREEVKVTKVRIPFLDSQSSQSESEQEVVKNSKSNVEQSAIEKCRLFKVWKPNEHGSNPGYAQTIFKCDTCALASKNEGTMMQHLEKSSHYSASSYKAVVESSQILLVTVCSMLDIVNPQGLYKAQVILCPDCHTVFRDVFMCALHHRKEHGSTNGMYSVCPVIGETKHQHNLCATCASTFNDKSGKGLTKHFRENPSHDPDSWKRKKAKARLYFCNFSSCHRQFLNFKVSFAHVQYHLKKQQFKEIQGNAITERLIAISKVSQELPPLEPTDESRLQKELKLTKELVMFHIKEARSKAKRSQAIHNYHDLCVQLGCAIELDFDGEEQDEDDVDDDSDGASHGWTQ